MSIELTITVKDEDRTLRKDFLVYEPFLLHHQDETLKKYIDETINEFQGEPQDIKIKSILVIK